MAMLNSGGATTPCPECGEPMGLVTWVGEKPSCARCSGATTVGTPDLGSGSDLDDYEDAKETLESYEEMMDTIRDIEPSDQDCLHEALERSLPRNQRGGPHMLVCNCPKCTIWC